MATVESNRLFLAVLSVTLSALASNPPARASELAIEPQFEAVGLFHEGLAPALRDGRWGFIDRSGAWVVEPTFERVLRGGDGRFGVRRNGLWGFMSTAGEMVIQPRYDEVGVFREGVAAVRRGQAWQYIRPDGAAALPFTFEAVGGRSGGYFLSKHNAVWKSIDSFGRVKEWYFTRNTELTVVAFTEGIALTSQGARIDFRDAKGNGLGFGGPILRARPFSSGFAAISLDGRRWGYITRSGNAVALGRFEAARDFSHGVAPVQLGGRWGYVDTTGRLVFRPSFDDAYAFREGYAVVRNGSARGFLRIDDTGRISVFVEPTFEDVFSFSEGLAPVKVDGRWGFLAAEKDSQPQLVRGVVDLAPN